MCYDRSYYIVRYFRIYFFIRFVRNLYACVQEEKIIKNPFLVSLILFFSLGCFTVYRTVTKTYNKIVNEGDDLIVKGASKTGSLVGKWLLLLVSRHMMEQEMF